MTKHQAKKASGRGGPPEAAAIVDKSRSIQLVAKPGETEDRLVARMAIRGVVANASTVMRFAAKDHPELSLQAMSDELEAQGAAVNRGDLSTLEQTLTAQALSLNSIFSELARIALCNVFKLPDVTDRYLRLALRAQSQSRATVETLATIKSPPVVFARQANINNGGQQQVNNAVTPSETRNSSAAYAGARAWEKGSEQNELIENGKDGCAQLDNGTTATKGRANQGMEPLDTLDRTAKR